MCVNVAAVTDVSAVTAVHPVTAVHAVMPDCAVPHRADHGIAHMCEILFPSRLYRRLSRDVTIAYTIPKWIIALLTAVSAK